MVNNLWDMKQTFSMAYDHCIENHKNSSSINIVAKEKWLDANSARFSKIDGFFEKFLALRLKYGSVDDKSQNVDSLLTEYNQTVEQTVVTLFDSFGAEGADKYCSALETQVNGLTVKINSLFDAKESLLETAFK